MKDWLEKLRETVMQPKCDEVPNGYYSAIEASKKYKLGKGATARILKRAVAEGHAKVIKLKRPTKAGGIVVTQYYGPK
jgi:hypothetical protein